MLGRLEDFGPASDAAGNLRDVLKVLTGNACRRVGLLELLGEHAAASGGSSCCDVCDAALAKHAPAASYSDLGDAARRLLRTVAVAEQRGCGPPFTGTVFERSGADSQWRRGLSPAQANALVTHLLADGALRLGRGSTETGGYFWTTLETGSDAAHGIRTFRKGVTVRHF